MYVQRCLSVFQLICLAIFLGRSQAKMNALMTNIECLNFMPEKIKNAKCWVNRTSKSTGTFSVEASFTEDVIDAKANYTLSIKRGSMIRQYLSIHVDCCEILRSIQSNYALKMLLSELRKSSNLPLDCPFKMNKLYFIKDFTVDTTVIPSYVPELDFIANTQLYNYKKKAAQVNIYGRLTRS